MLKHIVLMLLANPCKTIASFGLPISGKILLSASAKILYKKSDSELRTIGTAIRALVGHLEFRGVQFLNVKFLFPYNQMTKDTYPSSKNSSNSADHD